MIKGISDIFVGDTPVSSVYRGNELLWQRIQYVRFADPEVLKICLENWDTNGDGGLTKAELAAVSSIGTSFKNNTAIENFDEFQYFTGLKFNGQDNNVVFMGCTNLKYITIPSTFKKIPSWGAYGGYFTGAKLERLTLLNDIEFDTQIGVKEIVGLEYIKKIGKELWYKGDKRLILPNIVEIRSRIDSIPVIEIGDKLTKISTWQLALYTKSDIIIHAIEPPVLSSSNVFNHNVYVPDDSVEAYKAATNWSASATKIKPLSEFK